MTCNVAFTLKRMIESIITNEQAQHDPELDDEFCVPYFIMYVLEKPRR